MWGTHFFYFVLWLFYFGLHSALATTRVKSAVGLSSQQYRLVYNLLAVVLLLGLLFYGAVLESNFLFAPNQINFYIGLLLAATGIFVIKRAFRKYHTKAFLGLKTETHNQLHTHGLQKHVRHPLYSGTLLLVTGYFLFHPLLSNLMVWLAMCIYIPIGIIWEEKKLITAYGEAYLRYKRNTPAIFPNLNISVFK